jgi:hypothetical protein
MLIYCILWYKLERKKKREIVSPIVEPLSHRCRTPLPIVEYIPLLLNPSGPCQTYSTVITVPRRCRTCLAVVELLSQLPNPSHRCRTRWAVVKPCITLVVVRWVILPWFVMWVSCRPCSGSLRWSGCPRRHSLHRRRSSSLWWVSCCLRPGSLWRRGCPFLCSLCCGGATYRRLSLWRRCVSCDVVHAMQYPPLTPPTAGIRRQEHLLAVWRRRLGFWLKELGVRRVVAVFNC